MNRTESRMLQEASASGAQVFLDTLRGLRKTGYGGTPLVQSLSGDGDKLDFTPLNNFILREAAAMKDRTVDPDERALWHDAPRLVRDSNLETKLALLARMNVPFLLSIGRPNEELGVSQEMAKLLGLLVSRVEKDFSTDGLKKLNFCYLPIQAMWLWLSGTPFRFVSRAFAVQEFNRYDRVRNWRKRLADDGVTNRPFFDNIVLYTRIADTVINAINFKNATDASITATDLVVLLTACTLEKTVTKADLTDRHRFLVAHRVAESVTKLVRDGWLQPVGAAGKVGRRTPLMPTAKGWETFYRLCEALTKPTR